MQNNSGLTLEDTRVNCNNREIAFYLKKHIKVISTYLAGCHGNKYKGASTKDWWDQYYTWKIGQKGKHVAVES